jgi:hypothetical protein
MLSARRPLRLIENQHVVPTEAFAAAAGRWPAAPASLPRRSDRKQVPLATRCRGC